MVRIDCPACKKRLKIADEYQGRKIACPGCSQPIEVPAALPNFAEIASAPLPTKTQLPTLPTLPMTRGQGHLISLLLSGLLIATIAPHFLRDEPRWEYKVTAPSDARFEYEVDALGAVGWELVSARRATSAGGRGDASYECIFKRPMTGWGAMKAMAFIKSSEEAAKTGK